MARKATKIKSDEQPIGRRPAPELAANPGMTPETTGAKQEAAPQPDDDRNWLYERGSLWLAERTRRPQAAIHPLIVRWLRQLKDDATALRRLIVESGNLIEPIGWITIAVEAHAKKLASGGSHGRA